MTHPRRLLSWLRTHCPYIATRAHAAAIAHRMATLEKRHLADQQEIILRKLEANNLAGQVGPLKALLDSNLREIRRLTHERDQALDQVADLNREVHERQQAARFWIERTCEPHVCNN